MNQPKRIAAIVNEYRRHSHADLIVGKIFEGYLHDGKEFPKLQVVSMYVDQFPKAMADLSGWLGDGRLISPEHVVPGGIDAFPETLLMLFNGQNTGKLILSLDGE